MSNRQPDNRGVVLDEPVARALLYAAVTEHLVDDDRSVGDHIVEGILREPPPEPLLTTAFEQLVIGGKIYLPFPLPDDWKGDLFDRGIIQGTSRADDHEEIATIDPEVIFQMVRARDADWTRHKLQKVMERYLEASQRWEEISDGQDRIAFHVQQMLVETSRGSVPRPPAEKVAAARELNDASYAARLPLWCLRMYCHVVGAAVRLDALSYLPTPAVPSHGVEVVSADVGERVAILHVVSREFRTIPRAATLRDTVRLAATDEAAALREKLASWTECVRCGDVRLATVLRDVERARRELSTRQTLTSAGSLLTVVGLPLLAATPIIPAIADALGAAVTISGVLVGALAHDLAVRNRWAMLSTANLDSSA